MCATLRIFRIRGEEYNVSIEEVLRRWISLGAGAGAFAAAAADVDVGALSSMCAALLFFKALDCTWWSFVPSILHTVTSHVLQLANSW